MIASVLNTPVQNTPEQVCTIKPIQILSLQKHFIPIISLLACNLMFLFLLLFFFHLQPIKLLTQIKVESCKSKIHREMLNSRNKPQIQKSIRTSCSSLNNLFRQLKEGFFGEEGGSRKNQYVSEWQKTQISFSLSELLYSETFSTFFVVWKEEKIYLWFDSNLFYGVMRKR